MNFLFSIIYNNIEEEEMPKYLAIAAKVYKEIKKIIYLLKIRFKI